MSPPDDQKVLERLLSSAKSGNEAGLDELCRIIRVRLLGLIRFKVRNWSREDHEDLIQETLVIFVRDLPKIKDNPLTYAYAILQKRIWNEMDKARRNRELSLDHRLADGAGCDTVEIQDHSTDVADDVERKLKLERVWQAIQSLNHEFCQPLLTAIMEGYDIGELWMRFLQLDPKLNRNTFYKRVFDCRKRLWAVLGGSL